MSPCGTQCSTRRQCYPTASSKTKCRTSRRTCHHTCSRKNKKLLVKWTRKMKMRIGKRSRTGKESSKRRSWASSQRTRTMKMMKQMSLILICFSMTTRRRATIQMMSSSRTMRRLIRMRSSCARPTSTSISKATESTR